jgi:hypothetical protein
LARPSFQQSERRLGFVKFLLPAGQLERTLRFAIGMAFGGGGEEN